MKPKRVLFVAISHDLLDETSNKTGVWLEEIAVPYYVFKEAGFDLTIASLSGGEVLIDPKSESIIVATKSTKRFLNDPEAMEYLSHSCLIKDVKAFDFDVLFLTGGYGPMREVTVSNLVTKLIEAFNSESKPMAFLGRGVSAMYPAKDSNGEFLVKGKKITGFSNHEQESVGLTQKASFLLETELISIGALYSKGPDYVSYVVVDGNIITGQNPASSEEVANKVIAMLKLREYSASLEAVLS